MMDSEKFKKLTLKRELQRNDILKSIRHKQELIGDGDWLTEDVIENLEGVLNDAFMAAQVTDLSEFLVENIKDGLYQVLGRGNVEPHFTYDAKFRIKAAIREMFAKCEYIALGHDILDSYNENLVSKENVYAATFNSSERPIINDDVEEPEPESDLSVESIVMATVDVFKSTDGVFFAHAELIHQHGRYFMRLFSDQECMHELAHEGYKPICCDDRFDDYVVASFHNCKEKILVQGFDILDALTGRRYVCIREFNKYSRPSPFQDGVIHLQIYVPTLSPNSLCTSAYKCCDELDTAARQANILLCKGFMK